MSKSGKNQSAKALEDFISEAQDIMENLGRDLMLIDKSPEGQEKSPELVNNLFRGIHTFKSLSGMFGVEDLMNLAHQEESLLEQIRLGKTALNRQILNLLFESVELITRALGKVVPGGDIEDNSMRESLESFSSRLAVAGGENAAAISLPPRPSRDPMQMIGREVLEVLTEYEEHRLKANIKKGMPVYSIGMRFDLESIDVNLEDVRQRLRSLGEIITYLPSSDDSDHDKLGIDIVLVLTSSRETLEETLEGMIADIREVVPAQVHAQKMPTLVPPPVEKPTGAPDAPPASAPAPAPVRPPVRVSNLPVVHEEQAMSIRSVSQTVRVDIKKLDNLMNVVGELAVVRTGIARMSDKVSRLIGRSDLTIELDQLNRGLDRRLAALREGILEVRMVPLNQMFDRLARMVRKISLELGKEIHFVMSGADTEVDKLITEELSDPLMHLIRNAIDHGVEQPGLRAEAGKPEYGTVALTAYQKGSHVVIEVEDDGAGIDGERLVKAAKERGILDDDTADAMTPREVMNLIFLPGVSTSKQTTEISGRGVGMDIVKTNISALGGVVEVQSELRIGTKFTITLPITLATIPALLVSVHRRTYAIPLNTVTEAVFVSKQDIQPMLGNETVLIRNETLVLCRLTQFFGVKEQLSDPEELCVVVVSLGMQRLGLVVDLLHSQQDVVIKPLGAGLRDMTCFSGATDVGEERLALVIDTSQVIDQFFADQDGGDLRALAAVHR